MKRLADFVSIKIVEVGCGSKCKSQFSRITHRQKQFERLSGVNRYDLEAPGFCCERHDTEGLVHSRQLFCEVYDETVIASLMERLTSVCGPFWSGFRFCRDCAQCRLLPSAGVVPTAQLRRHAADDARNDKIVGRCTRERSCK